MRCGVVEWCSTRSRVKGRGAFGVAGDDLGGVDRERLVACIEACVDCAQACGACADAFVSEDAVAELTTCIRTNQDCADICETTARVLSRRTGCGANITRSVLQACMTACRSCADACGRHAGCSRALPWVRRGVPAVCCGL